MRISTTGLGPSEWGGDALVLFVPEGRMDLLDQLGPEAAAPAKEKASRLKYTGKEDSILAVELERGPVGSVYLAGLGGGGAPLPLDRWRRGVALAVRQAGKDRRVKMMALPGEAATPEVASALAEGALLAEYGFEKYKTQVEPAEKPEPLEELLVHGADGASLEKGSLRAAAQNYARDLANEPGNVISPAALAERALVMAQERGLDCEVLDEARMGEMGMKGILSVGSGSHNPPRLIHLAYRPEGASKGRVAFVGKGITFDSGGLNIKPGDYMRSMKGDKTGACNVLAVMRAVAGTRPDFEVHGFAGAAENMPGGGAYRPDDVIRMFNGKTVEVDNTDAEGRIVLGDVLAYASGSEPSVIVDMATLTGACVVALTRPASSATTGAGRLLQGSLGEDRREDLGTAHGRRPLEEEDPLRDRRRAQQRGEVRRRDHGGHVPA